MMKAIFLNDTSGTPNPGCQGTVSCLLRTMEDAGIEVVGRVPVGYGYHFFAPHRPSPPQSRLSRVMTGLRNRTVAASEIVASPSGEEAWRRGRDRMMQHLTPLWQDIEGVIINGEGTLHDDSIGAKTLLGMASAAKRLGLRVSLVNCSVFALSDWLLDVIRNEVDEVAVREPLSFRYLQSNGVTARLTADCLFLAGRGEICGGEPGRDERTTPYAVYSPGVLSGAGKVAAEAVAQDIRHLAAQGWEVFYFVVEAEDESLAGAAAEAGARIIPLGGMAWREVLPFLQNARCLVSGRYHLNIFAALAGTPFIPLETNTPKMQGLLEHLRADAGVEVRPWEEHDSVGAFDLSSAIRASAAALQACAALAQDNRPTIRSINVPL